MSILWVQTSNLYSSLLWLITYFDLLQYIILCFIRPYHLATDIIFIIQVTFNPSYDEPWMSITSSHSSQCPSCLAVVPYITSRNSFIEVPAYTIMAITVTYRQWQSQHAHYQQKWNIRKAQLKHSYLTFWFAGNGLAPTTSIVTLIQLSWVLLWTKMQPAMSKI